MQAAPLDVAAVRAVTRPFHEARTLPAEAYLSPDVLAWELEVFFERSWMCVGRADDLREPGDQRAVAIGDEGILLVRDGDGALVAFHNTCRHRGHELLPCGGEAVNRRVIQCPYHSWVYGLDGELRGAPWFADHPSFERSDPDNALRAARVESWGGWVFVNASGDAPPLAEHLGNLVELLDPYELDRLSSVEGHDYEIASNWKIVSENYHECYHCTEIHPELCKVTPPDSGVQVEPTGLFLGGSMELLDHAETMSLTGESRGAPFRRLDEKLRREVLYLQLMPNLLISAHPDYVMTHRLDPVAPDRTRIECRWLWAPESLELEGFDPSYASEFWDITNRQDWTACEAVQRGVAGRGFRQGPFSEMEGGVYQLAALVAQGYLAGKATGPVPTLPAKAMGLTEGA
ncbi:MAG TPA: aromatic ring-hydroxylating dioxygenase subunit alpha [Actinomycetota bacterium]